MERASTCWLAYSACRYPFTKPNLPLLLQQALYMALAGLKAEISSDMTDFKKELRADLRQAEDRWYTVSRDTATLKAVSDARTPPPPPSPKQEKQPDQQQQ